MSIAWKRPKNVLYPSVWLEFEGKKLINGNKRKYWVQDLTEEYYEECLKYMTTIFYDDEPLCSYSKLGEDKISVKESYAFWEAIFNQKMSLLCLTKDNNEETVVAGLNATVVSVKGSPKPNIPEGEKWRYSFEVFQYVNSLQDVYTMFNVDKYLTASGLLVLPDFRGEGLGSQIINAREPLCRAFGIKATFTVFTSTISQQLALKCGFKDIAEVPYADVDPDNTKFPGIQTHSKTFKYMYLRYD